MRAPVAWILLASAAAAAAVWVSGSRMPAGGGTALRWARSVTSQLMVRPRAPADPAELLDAFAAELTTGQPIRAALISAVADLPRNPCPEATRAAQVGGDVAGALRRDAEALGAVDLRALAACWEVTEHSGAALAEAVAGLATGVRAGADARGQLAGEVAAVRASARVLAALPVVGLGIGQWIGADPLTWLVSHAVGRLALVLGLGLQVAGVLWLRALVAGVRGGL